MTSLSRYTCEEAFRRLDDFLDHELSPAETELVRQHLELCAGCAREFNFEGSVLESVRAKLRQVVVPTDLLARVVALAARHFPSGEGDSVR